MQKNKIYNLSKKLDKVRFKIITPLLLLTIIPYFSFIWIIAFNPSYFGKMLLNSNISIGIFLGFLLILLIFFITIMYVYLANKKIEPLIKVIRNV